VSFEATSAEHLADGLFAGVYWRRPRGSVEYLQWVTQYAGFGVERRRRAELSPPKRPAP